MRKWLKATSVAAFAVAGLLLLGGGTAHADCSGDDHGHKPSHSYEDDSVNAVSSGDGSIAGGNQIIGDVDVPVNVCGVAVGAVGGIGNAVCDGSGAVAD
ncbi:DUF320 domain-containing protein [Spiractinospora alimapuensis]|uniref:chaplin family protein n=1 Tax=Spiractinospora alimapuensis TaxID=2820884 RepID=UPI001F405DD6|nr:chaplin family protein [Spiractinospora alimapuensis]QVQ50936.1 DUF320 domain-containing protein [Spiractinospora alimapuensis]